MYIYVYSTIYIYMYIVSRMRMLAAPSRARMRMLAAPSRGATCRRSHRVFGTSFNNSSVKSYQGWPRTAVVLKAQYQANPRLIACVDCIIARRSRRPPYHTALTGSLKYIDPRRFGKTSLPNRDVSGAACRCYETAHGAASPTKDLEPDVGTLGQAGSVCV